MADLQKALTEDLSGVPFRIVLSLRPLIDFWTRLAERQDSAKGAVARVIAAEVAKVPELLEPLTDCSLTERHEELLDLLMAAAFPPALSQHGYGAAMVPMQLHGFYATPPMERLLMTEDWHLKGRLNLEGPMIAAMRRAYAYGMVLEKVYGLELELNVPLILTVPDPDTGLDRHFRLLFDWTFVDVEVQGEKPALPADMRHRVQISLLDAAEMADALPSDRFVLRGFTILKALEVTEQEVLSALKRDLIDRESIVSKERFTGLEARLRTLFRRPQLQLGLGAIDGDRVLVLNDFSEHEHSCIFADSAHHTVAEFAGTIYARAVQKGEPIVIDDLATMPNRTPVEDAILASGVRTLVVAPLHYQDRVIGTLELGSPQPGDFDSSHLPALHQLRYRVERHAEQIRKGVAAGDETGIVAFLRAEVESLFEHLGTFGEAVRGAIEAYRGALDPRLGAVYGQRRVFEDSVTRVADMISSYLDLEEQAAQDIFPHYFEKQKTDGVDHQIYVGASLVEDGRFDPLYLKSLRIWQLMVACGIAARADRLTAELPVPLHTTHLVLVQHAPMSIRFRFDEKRFDVDGAYDIRYEIVKKRIDKALVKGSPERDHGLPANAINRAVVGSGEAGAWSRLERGELTLEAWCSPFEADCREQGVAVDARRLMTYIAEAGRERPRMLRAVARLRERGLRVGALTNNWAREETEPGPHRLRPHFDVVIESQALGMRKPDPPIYQLACRELRL